MNEGRERERERERERAREREKEKEKERKKRKGKGTEVRKETKKAAPRTCVLDFSRTKYRTENNLYAPPNRRWHRRCEEGQGARLGDDVVNVARVLSVRVMVQNENCRVHPNTPYV
jgi:hypothetical protein